MVCLFWVVLLECITSSNIPLGSNVQWRDKTCVPPCYKYVCKTSSQELVRLDLRARIDVSRGKLEIQVISVPQCQGVAFGLVSVPFARRVA